MTDKFKDISDDDLIAEIDRRGIANEFTDDFQGTIDELESEISRLEQVSGDIEDVNYTLRPIMELFRNKETEKFNKEMAEFFYEMFGVIV